MTAKPKRRSRAKPLIADTSDSACFSDLRWKGGVAYATFARDGSQYEYDMSRSEFKDWMDDDLGAYFNENIR